MTRYGIALREAALLYLRSPLMRQILPLYRYTQGCFIRNLPKYVRVSPGRATVTRYARAHPEECFLGMARRPAAPPVLPPCVAARYRVREELTLEDVPPGVLRAAERARKSAAALAALPPDFCGTLNRHVEESGMTRGEIAYRIGIDESTLYRLCHNPEASRSRGTVVALALLLQLEGPLWEDLLRKAGYCLNCTEDDLVLRYLLDLRPRLQIRECNALLVELQQKPLTARSEGVAAGTRVV